MRPVQPTRRGLGRRCYLARPRPLRPRPVDRRVVPRARPRLAVERPRPLPPAFLPPPRVPVFRVDLRRAVVFRPAPRPRAVRPRAVLLRAPLLRLGAAGSDDMSGDIGVMEPGSDMSPSSLPRLNSSCISLTSTSWMCGACAPCLACDCACEFAPARPSPSSRRASTRTCRTHTRARTLQPLGAALSAASDGRASARTVPECAARPGPGSKRSGCRPDGRAARRPWSRRAGGRAAPAGPLRPGSPR